MSARAWLLTAVALAAPALASAQGAGIREGGPKHLVITYRCPTATRAAFRDYMTKTGVARFERWKKDGVFQDYRLLFNWFVESDTWDMMAILSFEPYAKVARWVEIEQTDPGGLDRQAMALCAPLTSYPMDLAFQGGPAGKRTDSERSVFLTIPYVYYPASSLDDYMKYVSGYVIPQFDGWVKDGIVRSYKIYIARFQTSRPWQALFVLEYASVDAFGQRETEVDKVKAELAKDPAWKGLGDRKLAIRTEKETATAYELVPK